MRRRDFMFRLSLALLALGIVAAWTAAAAAEMVVLATAKDNTLIESDSGLLSNGAGPVMFTGRTSRFGVRRAMLAFLVSDSLPAQARVDSVRLELTMDQTNSGASIVSLHRMMRDWGEGASSDESGGGDLATAGDATWLHAFFPDSLWDQPGGDFVASPSASSLVDQSARYTWGSTQQMVSDVQNWVGNPTTNFGWILLGDETQVSAKRFATREAAENSRPRLIVYFTRPTAVEAKTWSVVKRLYR